MVKRKKIYKTICLFIKFFLTDIKCTNIISIKSGIQWAKNEEIAQLRMAEEIPEGELKYTTY